MKGNADSEAYAVQLLGEAQENAEMLKGQDAEAKKDGKTYEAYSTRAKVTVKNG